MKQFFFAFLFIYSTFVTGRPVDEVRLRFKESLPPQNSDLQFNRNWDCQKLSASNSYSGRTSMEFSLFGNLISVFYTSSRSETLVYEYASESLRAMVPDIYGNPVCEHYIRIHPDKYLVAETVCYRSQGMQAIANPKYAVSDYEICKLRKSTQDQVCN